MIIMTISLSLYENIVKTMLNKISNIIVSSQLKINSTISLVPYIHKLYEIYFIG